MDELNLAGNGPFSEEWVLGQERRALAASIFTGLCANAAPESVDFSDMDRALAFADYLIEKERETHKERLHAKA